MPLIVNNVENYKSFVRLLPSIVIAWVLITLWVRVLDVFTFKTLNMNRNSLFHVVVIAIVVTSILLVYVYYNDAVIDSLEGNAGAYYIDNPDLII